MNCPSCQHENPTEALFCMKCGTQLERKCPHCDAEYPQEALFCMKCGGKLGEGVSTTAEASVPKLEDLHTQLQTLIPDTLAQKYLSAEQEISGENRLITVLFVDISDFTPMSQQLPNEQVIERVNQCFRVVTDAVYRYEGSVNRFIGDCVLAFFGAPIAHENDTERAILAALEMQEQVSELGLRICIGINTGNMYFGSIGTRKHEEVSAYGPEVILAQRLQTTAEPGQILVGEVTYRHTRRSFAFEATGPLKLKGFEDTPTTAYRVVKALPHPEKVRGIEGLHSPMIGRDEEFAKLKSCLSELCDGRGQIASVIGVAGVGKSRLIRELKSAADEQVLWLEGRCLSIGESVGYWPFVDILKSYFQFDVNDTEPMMAEKITTAITGLLPQQADEVLPLFGNLLSVKFGNDLDNRLKFAGPEQVKHQTFIALRDLFVALAQRQPIAIILEDLHWADSLSLDLTNLLMEMLTLAPMMLLCVYRPEQEHKSWRIGSVASSKCLDRYTEIHVRELRPTESRRMVAELLRIENLPERIKNLIEEKSEGNPFFVEEVIRSLIDTEVVYHDGEVWRAKAEIESFIVPDTIQSVILTRIDRLEDEVKYALQCASVIGRLFRRRLLAYTSERERQLDDYLWKLEDSHLIYEERTVPEPEYSFKHVLTQETAYSSLLERRRSEFHHKVAEGIETLYDEWLEEFYGELAYHYDKSGDVDKAVKYLLLAGEKARKAYLNDEAIGCFQRVLALIDGLPQKEFWEESRLKALKALGRTKLGIGELAEAERHFQLALILAREMKLSTRQLVRFYHYLGDVLFWRSKYDEKIRLGKEGLVLLANDTECAEAAMMNQTIAIGYRHKGDLEKRREYSYRTASFLRNLPYVEELRASYDLVLWQYVFYDKDVDRALEWFSAYETVAQQHHDLRAQQGIYHRKASYFQMAGDLSKAILHHEKSRNLCVQIGDVKHRSWGLEGMSAALLVIGDVENAAEYKRQAHELMAEIGNKRDIANSHLHMGTILLCQGSVGVAVDTYLKGVELRRELGTSIVLTEALYLLGRGYIAQEQRSKATRHFQEAVVLSRALPRMYYQIRMPMLLSALEEAYDDPEALSAFCQKFRQEHPEAVESPFVQWYLEPTQPHDFPENRLSETFAKSLLADWTWHDPFDDGSFTVENGLEIHAANGRDLLHINLSAPRLFRGASGDFAAQTICIRALDDRPSIGGILLWKDKQNYLRLDRGTRGKHEINFAGCIDNEDIVIGRGRLVSQKAYLRLERVGNRVNALCSADGEEWFTAGSVEFVVDDPVEVGLHAIGMIDRTIYHGAYPDGTATVFRDFKLCTR